ncbi:hypothetical protein PG993_005834 [Apiospora rasikravindrae]|uniref:Uncharacterized protein n=1 Tax=Apiospora rasikravindrae TaxID=990691 RepID=A0ABR1T9X4_9PEZI
MMNNFFHRQSHPEIHILSLTKPYPTPNTSQALPPKHPTYHPRCVPKPPLFVVASLLLSVASAEPPAADPRNHARAFDVGFINSNIHVTRAAEPKPEPEPFVKRGDRGATFPPDSMPPPPTFSPGQDGGRPPKGKGHKSPHGDGGNHPESHTATWPPASPPTLQGTDSGSMDETR